MSTIIGEKMYNKRKELGLTLEEVGKAVGVGKSTVRKWEKGMIKNMGRDKIAALSKILQMNPVEFIPADESTDMMILRYMTNLNIRKEEEYADKYQLGKYPWYLSNKDEAKLIYAIRENEQLKKIIYRIRELNPEDIKKVDQMMDVMFSKEE